MSDLLEQQQAFATAFCRWGLAIEARGYRFTFGDAYRDPRATFPYSWPGTFHAKRLACDPNLFRDGAYLTSFDEWQECGELWESLGGTWGGRLKNVDPNHLSWGEGTRTA